MRVMDAKGKCELWSTEMATSLSGKRELELVWFNGTSEMDVDEPKMS